MHLSLYAFVSELTMTGTVLKPVIELNAMYGFSALQRPNAVRFHCFVTHFQFELSGFDSNSLVLCEEVYDEFLTTVYCILSAAMASTTNMVMS